MKTFLHRIAPALVVALCVTGCAGLDRVVYDPTKRPATASVDIYQDGRVPGRQYKQIAAFMAYGMRDEEVPAQKNMLAEARKIGANGLIFSVASAGVQAGLLGAAPKFTFKGIAIVYE